MKSSLQFHASQLRRHVCLSALVVPLWLMPAEAVFAAEPPIEAAQSNAAQPGEVAEITVTAQKRSENLQDVPIAISVVTGSMLKEGGVSQTMDLPQLVPGLVTVNVASVFLPFIRGIGSPSSQDGFESSVAVYLDGVYLSNKASTLFDFNNIKSVEVLKGPQGTLFGRNATGGAISITTKDPSDTPEFEADIGYGRFNAVSGRAYVSGPVTDTLGFNIAVTERRSDGYVREIYRHVTEGNVDSKGVMGKLKWDPSKAFSATLSAGFNDDSDPSAELTVGAPGTVTKAQAAGYPVATCTYCYASAFDPVAEAKSYYATLKAAYSFDKMRLVSISAYRRSSSVANLPSNAAETNISYALSTHFGKEFTQEIQLLSENSGPFQWITGVFFIHDDQGYNNGFNGLLVPLTSFVSAPLSADQLLSVNGKVANYNTHIVTQSEAAFVQGTYAITPNDKITAGIRYSVDKKTAEGGLNFITAVAGASGAQFVTTPVSSFGPNGISTTFKKPTWRLAYDHVFTRNLMAYASYDRGYKSGSYSPTVVSPTAAAVSPEILDAYEGGIKSEFFHHRLRVNAAGYYYNYKNIQVQVINGNISSVQNAANATAYGADLDSELIATEQLSFNLGLNLSHSEYKSFLNAAVFVPVATGGTQLQTRDAAGHPLVYAPSATITAGAKYEVPLKDGRLVLNATAYHNSGYDQTPLGISTHTNAFTDIGLSATWHTTNDRFSVSLWGQNVTNEHHAAWFNTSASGIYESLTKPATYGFTMGYKFGS